MLAFPAADIDQEERVIPGPFGWSNRLTLSPQPFTGAQLTRLRAAIPGFDAMGVAIIDVSGTSPIGYATNFTKTGFAASLVKIVAMYAAFYLQDRLRSMSGFFGTKRLEEVESLLRKEWRVALRAGVPRQTGDFPDISRIFGSTSFTFSKRFASNMNAMMKLSDNGASGQCIRAIGYDYINGALVHGGFFDPTAKSGFWLAGDYTKDTDPSNRDGATIPGLGTTQAASAKAVSLMLANLARNELISPAASAGIRVVMSDAISWIAPTIQSTHPDATILNKIGLAGSVHDCAIVQYSNAHYAFCALFSQGYGIEPLFAELDRLAQELFAVSMVRDGARTMVRVLKL